MKDKKEKKIILTLPIFLIVALIIFSSIGTSYAASYLFDAKDVSYDNNTSGINSDNVQDAIDELYSSANDYEGISTRLSAVEDYKNQIYPVGSIYISVSSTNPSTLFGGTWVAFGSGKKLVGINTNDTSFDVIEETGGSKTVTLDTGNLPAHTHTYDKANSTSGSTALTLAQIPYHRHSFTPSGTVSKPTFTGTKGTSDANNRGHTHSWTDHYANTTSGSTTLTVDQIPAHNHKLKISTYDAVYAGYFLSGNTQGGITYNATASTALSIANTGGGKGHTHSISNTSTSRTSGPVSQNHTHTYTPSGTVSQPTFTGTAGNTGYAGGNSSNSNKTDGHTHSIATTSTNSGSTGSGTAFSTMDPYITVYMWKRTA